MQSNFLRFIGSYHAMRIYALLLFLAMLLGTGFSSVINERLTTQYTAWINAAVSVKVEGTTAHLWFEEIVSGDTGQDIETDVWQHLDLADFHTNNLLQGASIDGIVFAGVDHAETKKHIQNLQLHLHQFRMIAKRRYQLYQHNNATQSSRAGSEIDQQFDATFDAFSHDANMIRQHIHTLMLQDFNVFKRMQYILGALLLLALLSILLLLKTHERRQRSDQEQLRLLANFPEENPNPVLFINANHQIAYANPPAQQLLTALHIMLDDIAPSLWLSYCERARSEKAEHAMDLVFEGSHYILYFQGTKHDDVHVYGRDVSELKKIQRDHGKMVRLIESTTDLVAMATADGHISYMNAAGRNLFELALDKDLSQKRIVDFHPALENEHIRQHMMPHAMAKGSWRGESIFLHPDGSDIPMSIVLMYHSNTAGEDNYFSLIARDLREEKDMQSKIEHTQRLESLGVLAGGIAHDFNNILTAIMGNAGLARRRMEDTHPATEHLTRIVNASDKAAALCKQMLAYSGKGRFVIKHIHLPTLVTDMAALLEVSIAKNVVIRYDMIEGIPLVEVDVAQIQQVVMNLITNANEAIDGRSGIISIATSVFHADRTYLQTTFSDENLEAGNFVTLEVSDNGCGMDKETMQKMFDPFFTTKFTGRGLGMSAVLGIIRGHSGALKVYSEPGRGTTFKILLPAVDSSSQPLPTPIQAIHTDLDIHGAVLVVDDEEVIRDTAASILRDIGFEHVLSAQDGLEGVALYQEHQERIQFVLLDMTMPKLDGEATFRELRRINPDVVVILSSGYNEQDATQRFTGKGLAGFIQKPYLPEQLQSLLQEVFSQKK
ncbi:MAG: response regulator [Mariprofundaceae bacterium]|nr:response regulator [Mariprofundaceae bacterium]